MIWNISGYGVLLDDDDYERLKSYNYHVNRYDEKRKSLYYFLRNIYVGGKRTKISLHRDIMGCIKGDGLIVDHKDGNTLDCRKANLRLSTPAENCRNCKTYKNNSSGVKGVNWHKRDGVWCAGIRVNGKRIDLGSFSDINTAEAAYTEASIKYHGEFRRIGD